MSKIFKSLVDRKIVRKNWAGRKDLMEISVVTI